MSEKQQRLVLSILDFLNQSITDGTVKADDKESLEVAIQCIGEAFGVDPSDEKQVERLSVKPATLQSIFDVYLKTRDKVGSSSQGSSTPAPKQTGPTKEDKAKAEEFKAKGNSLMSSKKYDEAIESYSQAITLDPTNPIYYSNRAAAYSSKGDHLSAIGDAELALANDPSFVKAYHRLGHAQYCLSDFKAAADAFERGLKLDPNNAGLKSGLQNAKARIPKDDDDEGPPPLIPDDGSSPTPRARGGAGAGAGGMPDLSGMADMLRGMGGGGAGGGGMPDMSSILNNPQMMAMAQQMMSNGGLANLMQNPAVADMMNRVQSGDMPSMDEIMSNPALRNLANQFGAGGGQ
ncbi:Small glutamine-rich tetratricopeptide repeat-containing protein 2 [Paramarasmius palmivorus]|uniref:Small glutamine-rich tetratricopeptide repeat-containing protein 2 n=1 Tax=Paramarasmius palmivorus TaxID=297713 RepID=A0AAW0BS33_9AGAR